MFGLKGNADACVAFSDPNIRNSGNNNNNNSRIIGPLEIKTGKVSTEGSHRAQTTLYSLLMKDHYRKAPFSPSHSSRISNPSIF